MNRYLLFLLAFPACAALAQFDTSIEYMSVKPDQAEVRENPNEHAAVLWEMWKYMPVQVVAFRGDWRRIRDLDGDEGWMHKDVLSDIPTVMVRSKAANLRKTRGGKVDWVLERGFPLRVFGTTGDWVEVSDLLAVGGWIHKTTVWGNIPRTH
ncbi:MAG: SH3 domain-containing protein [Elusimicrobiota bacterium]